jgi:putative transposase
VWVAAITYIRLLEEFAYLAVLLDAFSRRVIDWAFAKHLRASLAIEARGMAISARPPVPGSLIHHSDRGVQYACGEYAAMLETYDIQLSRRSQPLDRMALRRVTGRPTGFPRSSKPTRLPCPLQLAPGA